MASEVLICSSKSLCSRDPWYLPDLISHPRPRCLLPPSSPQTNPLFWTGTLTGSYIWHIAFVTSVFYSYPSSVKPFRISDPTSMFLNPQHKEMLPINLLPATLSVRSFFISTSLFLSRESPTCPAPFVMWGHPAGDMWRTPWSLVLKGHSTFHGKDHG